MFLVWADACGSQRLVLYVSSYLLPCLRKGLLIPTVYTRLPVPPASVLAPVSTQKYLHYGHMLLGICTLILLVV